MLDILSLDDDIPVAAGSGQAAPAPGPPQPLDPMAELMGLNSLTDSPSPANGHSILPVQGQDHDPTLHTHTIPFNSAGTFAAMDDQLALKVILAQIP